MQEEERETERSPDSRELSPLEAARQDSYDSTLRDLRVLEPSYSELKPSGWIPDEAAVASIKARLRAAQARAAAKAPGALASALPTTGDELILGLPRPFPPTDTPFSHIEKPPARPYPTGTPQDAPEAAPEKPKPLPIDKPNKPAKTGSVPSPPDSNSALNPPIRLEHIIDGDINAAGRAGGFHLRPGGKDPASARMMRLERQPNKLGMYVVRSRFVIQKRAGLKLKNFHQASFQTALPRSKSQRQSIQPSEWPQGECDRGPPHSRRDRQRDEQAPRRSRGT